MPSDEQLMARVATGDMDAFEELVRRHQRRALSIAYRFLGDPDQAADVAQEAFLRILAAAPRYRPSASFSTYLHRIIWHLCVDLHRRRRPGSLHELAPREDPTPGPPETALARERGDLVRRALSGLPPRQKMALVLKHYEDLSYAEIASTLDCSARAVEALLARARQKLRAALEGLI